MVLNMNALMMRSKGKIKRYLQQMKINIKAMKKLM